MARVALLTVTAARSLGGGAGGELPGGQGAKTGEQDAEDGDGGDGAGGDGVDAGQGAGGGELGCEIRPGLVGPAGRADGTGYGVCVPVQVSGWGPVPPVPGQVTITWNGRSRR